MLSFHSFEYYLIHLHITSLLKTEIFEWSSASSPQEVKLSALQYTAVYIPLYVCQDGYVGNSINSSWVTTGNTAR